DGDEPSQVDGRARFQPHRIRHLVEGRAGDRHRRDEDRGHRDRDVLPPGCQPHGEGRHLHPDPAARPVAAQGGRSARRRAERTRLLLRTRSAHPEKLADSDDPRDRPLLDLTWDYPIDEAGEVDAEAVLAEINGYFIGGERDGQPLDNFNQMTSDGTTAGGCWIYAGVYSGGENMAARRRPRTEQDETAAEWAWAWPANRRILYNRASAAPDGTPWSERKKFVWWDEDAGKWTGKDVPDFPIDRAPAARSDQAYGGPAHLDGDDPFIMQADGKGWLFAPSGMVDGPMPTHYE